MPTLTEGRTLGDVLKVEQEHQLSRNAVTLKGLASGTAFWPVGTLLARETATGKWALATNTGSDGLEQPRAILAVPVSMTTADKAGVPVADRGPARLNQLAVTFGPTIDDATKRAAALAKLEANTAFKANPGA